VIIPINEEIRIAGTERCWELQRLRNFKGGKRWEAYKWFATFRQALDEAVHREIRLHPARNLADAIEAVSTILRRVSDLIPPDYKLER
jgi:hypothetical protein